MSTIVAVGSENKAKVASVIRALQVAFPDKTFEIRPHSVLTLYSHSVSRFSFSLSPFRSRFGLIAVLLAGEVRCERSAHVRSRIY